jgi:hypothetical protein
MAECFGFWGGANTSSNFGTSNADVRTVRDSRMSRYQPQGSGEMAVFKGFVTSPWHVSASSLPGSWDRSPKLESRIQDLQLSFVASACPVRALSFNEFFCLIS